MHYRIPADPRRKEIRTRVQAALFCRAMPRTSRVQTVRTAAHKQCAMPRTVRNSSVAQSVCSVERAMQLFCCAVCVQCRAQPAALPTCNPFAMPRTSRCSSVAQSVRTAAHNPLPNAAPQVVQSDADATCLQLRVVATATSRNAAAKRKTASGVRDQENSMETSAERLQLHSDTRVASCGG